MYSTLRPELITATPRQRAMMSQEPTYVVEKGMFTANQFPYLEVRRPFILGTKAKEWKATISHRFMELLHDHGKLTRLFTQNIDGLDYQCDVPHEKIVPVHGSLGRVSCEHCGAPCDFEQFCNDVQAKIKDIYGRDPLAPAESSNIACAECGQNQLKPSTVLFGGRLPPEFFQHVSSDLPSCDLLIIAGTSLVVAPANSVASRVPASTRRLVVNREPVGAELGIDYSGGDASRDVFSQGDCDESFLELIKKLGWLDELAAMHSKLPPESQRRLEAARPLPVPDDPGGGTKKRRTDETTDGTG